ncbi:MAG TPA: MTAP family purine nucleoside phosphorylase [Phycisphaerae bacterium]|nr:MTAP family purine nucleoside phosphorylase [Phycisphaerae bacterium]
MAATIACIAGEEVHRQWDARRIGGERLGPRPTPFGDSGEIFLVTENGRSFYLLPRYGAGLRKTAPRRVNDRANLYALKDLGVQAVLAWGPGGAITHTIAVGDLVVLDDLIDRTYLRSKTFFEDSPLGFLRQFPVFCPSLRRVVSEVLHEMKLVYHGAGTAAVCEGPRLETPAEVRVLGALGAEVVTHSFVPEVFLAKELQLCYAAVCYVVNYAETGSRHRPFAAGELFGGLTQESDSDRLAGAVGAMSRIVSNVAEAAERQQRVDCDCGATMAHHVRQYDLPDDWRQWFGWRGL